MGVYLAEALGSLSRPHEIDLDVIEARHGRHVGDAEGPVLVVRDVALDDGTGGTCRTKELLVAAA
jgi:hypothetical protein